MSLMEKIVFLWLKNLKVVKLYYLKKQNFDFFYTFECKKGGAPRG